MKKSSKLKYIFVSTTLVHLLSSFAFANPTNHTRLEKRVNFPISELNQCSSDSSFGKERTLEIVKIAIDAYNKELLRVLNVIYQKTPQGKILESEVLQGFIPVPNIISDLKDLKHETKTKTHDIEKQLEEKRTAVDLQSEISATYFPIPPVVKVLEPNGKIREFEMGEWVNNINAQVDTLDQGLQRYISIAQSFQVYDKLKPEDPFELETTPSLSNEMKCFVTLIDARTASNRVYLKKVEFDPQTGHQIYSFPSVAAELGIKKSETESDSISQFLFLSQVENGIAPPFSGFTFLRTMTSSGKYKVFKPIYDTYKSSEALDIYTKLYRIGDVP